MRSLLGWPGGKHYMAKTIVALLPEHQCYVEVFGGAAWVLFAKERGRCEIYNDLDGRLVELFRCVKYHAEKLTRELQLLVPSRQIWEEFRAQPGLTDIQRAARFFYVLRLSFGSRTAHFASGPGRAGAGAFLLERMLAQMDDVRGRPPSA